MIHSYFAVLVRYVWTCNKLRQLVHFLNGPKENRSSCQLASSQANPFTSSGTEVSNKNVVVQLVLHCMPWQRGGDPEREDAPWDQCYGTRIVISVYSLPPRLNNETFQMGMWWWAYAIYLYFTADLSTAEIPWVADKGKVITPSCCGTIWKLLGWHNRWPKQAAYLTQKLQYGPTAASIFRRGEQAEL